MFKAVNNLLLHKVEIKHDGIAHLIWEKINFDPPITVTNEGPERSDQTAHPVYTAETEVYYPHGEPKISRESGSQKLTHVPKKDNQFRFEALPGAASASLNRRSAIMVFLPPDYIVDLDQPTGKALGLDRVYTGQYTEPLSGRLSIVATTLIGFNLDNEDTSSYGCSYNVKLSPTSAANKLAQAKDDKNAFLSDWGFANTRRQIQHFSRENTAEVAALSAASAGITIWPILYAMINLAH